MRKVRIFLAAAALATGAVTLPAAGASAATPDAPPAFGNHVSECAKTMGFTGAHNPGMHPGAAGWGGMTSTAP